MSSEGEFNFEYISSNLVSLSSSIAKECLLQWNLDEKILNIKTFRIFGPFSRSSKNEDYERLLNSFLQSSEFRNNFPITGQMAAPVSIQLSNLSNNIMSMQFFEQLKSSMEILTPSGNIRGCFEECFDGIVVNDCLREMLV